MSMELEKKAGPELQKLAPKGKPRRYTTGTRRDGSWRPKFIEALKEQANIGHACDQAGVTRTTAANHRQASGAFRAAWDNAMKIGVERDEQRLHEYAHSGVPEVEMLLVETTTENRFRYEKGPDGKVRAIPQVVKTNKYQRYEKRTPSVTALIFRLKAHNPEKYRDNFRAQVSNAPVPAVAAMVETDVARLPTEELERIVAGAVARGALSPDTLAMVEAANPELAPDDGKPGNGAR